MQLQEHSSLLASLNYTNEKLANHLVRHKGECFIQINSDCIQIVNVFQQHQNVGYHQHQLRPFRIVIIEQQHIKD